MVYNLPEIWEIYPSLYVHLPGHLPDSDVISLILKPDLPEYLDNILTGLWSYYSW
jgi:hypothetical protein